MNAFLNETIFTLFEEAPCLCQHNKNWDCPLCQPQHFTWTTLLKSKNNTKKDVSCHSPFTDKETSMERLRMQSIRAVKFTQDHAALV